MTLVTRADFNGESELQVGKKNMAKVKKDLWINEAGDIAEGNDGLPKGWRKGKLLARAGTELSDAQAKLWKVSTKAKAPAENKGK